MVTAAAWLWQFASCFPYKLPSNFLAFWPLFWSIRGSYRSSANRDDHIQALYLKPPGSAGLDEEAHLHGVVNSLYVLISATICVLAWAGETGALGIYSRR